jgi:hypothetical protein
MVRLRPRISPIWIEKAKKLSDPVRPILSYRGLMSETQSTPAGTGPGPSRLIPTALKIDSSIEDSPGW